MTMLLAFVGPKDSVVQEHPVGSPKNQSFGNGLTGQVQSISGVTEFVRYPQLHNGLTMPFY